MQEDTPFTVFSISASKSTGSCRNEEADIPVFPHSPGKQPKEQKNKQQSERTLPFAEPQGQTQNKSPVALFFRKSPHWWLSERRGGLSCLYILVLFKTTI